MSKNNNNYKFIIAINKKIDYLNILVKFIHVKKIKIKIFTLEYLLKMIYSIPIYKNYENDFLKLYFYLFYINILIYKIICLY